MSEKTEQVNVIPGTDPHVGKHRLAARGLMGVQLTLRDIAKLLKQIEVNPDCELTDEIAELADAIKVVDATTKHVTGKLEALEPYDPAEWKPDVVDPLASDDWVVVRPMTRDDALAAVGFARTRLHDFPKEIDATEFPPDGTEPWPSKSAIVTGVKVKYLEHNINAVYHENGSYHMIQYRGRTKRIVKNGEGA